MDANTKAILMAMLGEIEELQATVAVVSRFVSPAPTVLEAREAKNLALQANRARFDKLRKQIKALSL